MNNNEYVYLDFLRSILRNGKKRDDRTGVGTIGYFGAQMRYDLQEGFPLLTTKKIDLKSVLSELLWFIEGSGDERRLAEIRYGKNAGELADKRTIWTANAQAPYWKPKAKFEGDLGRVYGVQWRKWETPVRKDYHYGEDGEYVGTEIKIKETDQLANLIEGIKNDPNGRRHILTAWNPGELDQMALPPCHVMSQFYVADGRLSCMLTQRSADAFLGVPFNVASYALFTHMIAAVCGLEVGEFIHSIGDAHIYANHIEAVEEQLSRAPASPPKLLLEPRESIDEFTMDDFVLVGYEPQAAIPAPMAV